MMPLRARDIADICDELAIERASVTVMGGWDPDATQFALTFGPLAYRRTETVDPNWTADELKAKLGEWATPALDLNTKEYTPKQWTPEEVKGFKPAKEMPGKVEIANPPKSKTKGKNGK